MDINVFEAIVKEQIERSKKVLIGKADEYAKGGDRLHNFKVAGELMGISTKQAVAGMMAKHTTSIYDMCMSDDDYSTEMWNEKITDHINYLLLLRATVEPMVVLYADDKVYGTYREEKTDE